MKIQSLFFTIYGDYIKDVGDSISLKSLIRIFKEFGFSEGAVRAGMHRMKKRGLVITIKDVKNKKISYKLSQKGMLRLSEGTKRVYEKARKKWDGKWRIVVYNIPEGNRELRDKLRKELRWLGFGMLAQSTWISPNPMENIVLKFVEEINNSTKKLIIASINGHCMDGGLELALACDLRFGANSEEIKIGMPEVANLALIPGEGGTQFLARIVGRSKAIYLMTTGKTLTPKEAYELGLLDRLVEPEKLFEESFNFARQVAKGPALAVGFAKLAVNEGMDLPLYSAFALEREMQNQALASEDAKEGAKAFFEKRKPIFKGK
ncbi:hypothetical protein DJ527_07025 [Sulfolobus sp. F1]|nr:hypothetical protein DJ527_07025 [Sulfolobus sp. F1]